MNDLDPPMSKEEFQAYRKMASSLIFRAFLAGFTLGFLLLLLLVKS